MGALISFLLGGLGVGIIRGVTSLKKRNFEVEHADKALTVVFRGIPVLQMTEQGKCYRFFATGKNVHGRIAVVHGNVSEDGLVEVNWQTPTAEGAKFWNWNVEKGNVDEGLKEKVEFGDIIID